MPICPLGASLVGRDFCVFPQTEKTKNGNLESSQIPPDASQLQQNSLHTSSIGTSEVIHMISDEENKYNTLIIKRLPGSWFGLSEDVNQWEGDSNDAASTSNYSISPSLHSNETSLTTNTIRTNGPFLSLLRGVFSAFGAVRHLDAQIYQEDKFGNELFPGEVGFDGGAIGDDQSVSTMGSIDTRKQKPTENVVGLKASRSDRPQVPKKIRRKTNNRFRRSLDGKEIMNALGGDEEGDGRRPKSPMLERWVKEGLTGLSAEEGDGSSTLEAGGGEVGMGSSVMGSEVLEPSVLTEDKSADEREDDGGGEGDEDSDLDEGLEMDGEATALALIGDEKEHYELQDLTLQEEEEKKTENDSATGGLSNSKSSRPLPPIPQSTKAAQNTMTTTSPLPNHLAGQYFSVVVQFKQSVSFHRCFKLLADNYLSQVNAVSMNGKAVHYVTKLIAVKDTRGYFSKSLMEYRERKQRIFEKERLKAEILRSREEKKCVRKARDKIEQCWNSLEGFEGDLEAITNDSGLMRHRPTSVSVAGAKDRLDKCKRMVEGIKSRPLPRSEGELKIVLGELRRAFQHCKSCVKQASDIADKVMIEREMQLPGLEKALLDNNCGFFLSKLKEFGLDKLQGVTILAPIDEAFYDDPDTFEIDSMSVHVIDGPYLCGDMLTLNGGCTQPRSDDYRHAIRTRMDRGGKFTFQLTGDSQPPRKIEAVNPDVPVIKGTVVHVVDNILFPGDVQNF